MIPTQLRGEGRFLRLEPEGKAPAVETGQSPDGPFYESGEEELADWIKDGGNVGLNLGPLVCLDVDHGEFRRLIEEHLPRSFSVRSGGGGEHRYYRCDWSGRRAFSEGDQELGSIRSGNWYVVVPPSIHPSGNQYQVLEDRAIQPLPEAQLLDFLEEATGRWGTANTGGGAARRGGSAGGIPSIPEEYPGEKVEWETCKKWLKANGLLSDMKLSTGDRSGREFKLAKCLAEGGFSEGSIKRALDRLPHNSKWHERGDRYRNRTVRKAVVAAVNDPYVTFDSPDDPGKRGVPGEGKPQGETTMAEGTSFKELESVVKLGSDGGAVQARLMQGTEEGGETFEYVDLATGEVEEMETVDGETVEVPNIDDGPGETDSLGSPESLEAKIEALQELAEQINHD